MMGFLYASNKAFLTHTIVFYCSSSVFFVGFILFLITLSFFILVCFKLEKMVGIRELSVIFEKKDGRPKIARVAPVFDFVKAHCNAIPEPRLKAVNGSVEWKILDEDCQIYDIVYDADGVVFMPMYTNLMARGFQLLMSGFFYDVLDNFNVAPIQLQSSCWKHITSYCFDARRGSQPQSSTGV